VPRVLVAPQPVFAVPVVPVVQPAGHWVWQKVPGRVFGRWVCVPFVAVAPVVVQPQIQAPAPTQ
jgi:hypothetical protein